MPIQQSQYSLLCKPIIDHIIEDQRSLGQGNDKVSHLRRSLILIVFFRLHFCACAVIWRTRFAGSRGRVNWVAGVAPSCVRQAAARHVFQVRWALSSPSWARSAPSAQQQPSGPVNSTRMVGFEPSTYRSVLRGGNHYTTSKGQL